MNQQQGEFEFKIAKHLFPSILEKIPTIPQPPLRFQLKILGEYHPFEPSLLQDQGDYVIITDGFEGLGILLNRKQVCHFDLIISYKNEGSSEVKSTTLHTAMENGQAMYKRGPYLVDPVLFGKYIPPQQNINPEDCVLILF
jgi:hypothetical protein